MPHTDGADRVCILLGLYNGAADLPAQLQSFADQDHPHWDLVVSDDGSADAGPEIVRAFAERMRGAGRRVDLVDGPRDGFAANFLSLLARPAGRARWLALSDQDDVWLPDRLSRGLAALRALPEDHPALYCSRTWVTDEHLGQRKLSMRFARPPGFRNALVQNIAAGNTILLNPAAAALARAAAPLAAATAPGVAAHDWWLYQMITGAGGTVIHDPEPTLLYRQHPGNQIGANLGWRARISRIGMLLGGRFSDWNAGNITALQACADHLTPENRLYVTRFGALRAMPLRRRLRAFAASGLYRQSGLGQTALWVAVLLRRI